MIEQETEFCDCDTLHQDLPQKRSHGWYIKLIKETKEGSCYEIFILWERIIK